MSRHLNEIDVVPCPVLRMLIGPLEALMMVTPPQDVAACHNVHQSRGRYMCKLVQVKIDFVSHSLPRLILRYKLQRTRAKKKAYPLPWSGLTSSSIGNSSGVVFGFRIQHTHQLQHIPTHKTK